MYKTTFYHTAYMLCLHLGMYYVDCKFFITINTFFKLYILLFFTTYPFFNSGRITVPILLY